MWIYVYLSCSELIVLPKVWKFSLNNAYFSFYFFLSRIVLIFCAPSLVHLFFSVIFILGSILSSVLYINNSLFSSVQSLSHVQLFVIPWTTARQASLSITNQSPPKHMSIVLVMPSNHLILCRPCLLLPPIPPSIRVFSNESALHNRWPTFQSFSFNISP